MNSKRVLVFAVGILAAILLVIGIRNGQERVEILKQYDSLKLMLVTSDFSAIGSVFLIRGFDDGELRTETNHAVNILKSKFWRETIPLNEEAIPFGTEVDLYEGWTRAKLYPGSYISEIRTFHELLKTTNGWRFTGASGQAADFSY